MTRIFSHQLSMQMLLLWLVESLICFVLLSMLFGAGLPHGGEAAADLAATQAAAGLTVLTGIVSAALGLYRPETFLQTRMLLIKVLIAAAASLPVIWQVGKAVHIEIGAIYSWNAMWPVDMLLSWAAVLLTSRLIYSRALKLDLFTRRLLVVGSEAEAERLVAAVAANEGRQFAIAGTAAELADAAPGGPRPWAVVLAETGRATVDGIAALRSRGVRVLSDREFWERHLGRVDVAGPFGLEDDRPARRVISPGAMASRALDISVSLALIIFTLPLMLFTAVLIKIESEGPVLYRQERVGLAGRVFTLAKFRSMRVDAEAAGPVWAARRDSRVTRVGGFIRKVRIDELPQLLNVLKGEMSLIGPRPERPHFVRQLNEVIPGYSERARVKPGVTGWAQVNYPYGASVEDARAKLSYDLYYVKYRSLLLDIMILFATVRVVLFQEGSR